MSFQFNGVTTAPPYFFKVDLIDQDSTGTQRNANGYLVRERVRGGSQAVRKLSFRFRQLSSSDTSTLLQAIANESFTCQYPDPYTGALRTATIYVGNRSSSLSTYISGVPVWGEIEFNGVEY